MRHRGPRSLRLEHRAIAGLAAAFALRVWLAALPSSFTLDEAGLLWVVQPSSLGEVLRRAAHFPQSPAYALLVWVLSGAVGPGEVALRLPSLAASLALLLVVAALAREVAGRTAAPCAAAAWLLIPEVQRQGALCRPYAPSALAFGVGLLVALRWRAAPSRGRALAAGAAFAASIHLWYFAALPVLATLGGLLAAGAAGSRERRGHLALGGLTGLALLLPLGLHTAAVAGSGALHGLARGPSLVEVVEALAPSALVGAALVAVAVGAALDGGRRVRLRLRRPAASLLAAAALLPAAALVVSSRLTGVHTYSERYVFASSVGIAVIVGACVASLGRAGRLTFVVVGLGLSMVNTGYATRLRVTHDGNDWRELSRVVAEAPPAALLATSRFVEGSRVPYPAGEDDAASLLAPLTAAYPVDRPPRLIPGQVDERTRGAREEEVRRLRAEGPPRVVLVDSTDYAGADWLVDGLRGVYRRRLLAVSGATRVSLLEREAP